VAQNAYCNECCARVTVADEGGCENGHARSALRDVREGALANTAHPIPTVSAGPASAAAAASGSPGAPNPAPKQELASRVIGVLIIALPSVLIVAVAFWSSYAASIAFGMTRNGAFWSSLGSLVLTGALVVVWVAKRRSAHK